MNWFNQAAAVIAAACAVPAAASTLSVVYDTANEPAPTSLQAPVPVAGGRIIGQSNGRANSTPDLGQVYLLSPGAAGAPYAKTQIHAWGPENGPTANTDGVDPSGNLTADAQGNLWGTTNGQGANGTGTLFELIHPATPAGAWTYKVVLSLPASLSGSNGSGYGSLIFDPAGNLYGLSIGGTTANGCTGTACGAIWKVPAATLAGGTKPITRLLIIPGRFLVATSMVRDAQGNFFAASSVNQNPGFIWEASPTGTGAYGIKALHRFCLLSQCVDGSTPTSVVVAKSGALFGATAFGGGAGYGVIFRMTPTPNNGFAFRVIHDFAQVDANGLTSADKGVGVVTGMTLAGSRILATAQDGGGSDPACTPGVAPSASGCQYRLGAVLSIAGGSGADTIFDNEFGTYQHNLPYPVGPAQPLFAPIVDKSGAVLGASALNVSSGSNLSFNGVIYRITK